MIEELFQELSLRPEVEAIALGGSRAGEHYDKKSDYDVYVYCKGFLSEETRTEILSRYCREMEIGNHFWEYEDNCTLNDGIDIDILYRDLDEFVGGIAEVVDRSQVHNGYTTCMWHNLITCKVVYDKDGRLTLAKNRYTVAYPAKLKDAMIKHHRKLLRYSLPAYERQIAKAAARGDMVSINHRVTEFMASYFDLLFALNEMTHPGEKRLVEICMQQCRILPDHFEQNIHQLFHDMFADSGKINEDINKILTELEKVCG